MKNIDLEYICKVTGDLAGMPIRIFKGEDRIFYHSVVPLSKDPMTVYKKEINNIKNNVGYFVTKSFNYYGIINYEDYKIVMGPTGQVPAKEQDIRELAFKADVSADEIDDFVAAVKNIVNMPFESVMQMLCTINYILNDEKLEIKDISIYDDEQDKLKALLVRQNDVNSNIHGDPANSNSLNSYDFEQKMLRMVRTGDLNSLRELVAAAPAIRGGTLAADQLRHIKNTFVVTATLVSRAAIQGGMSVNDAFSLSDEFIRRCELLNSLERITNLQYHMILEYTERTAKIRIGKNPGKLTLDVSNYIQHHLSEVISAEKIAAELFISRPYLSKKFKEETGETLTDFILKTKIEEAKKLLRYTEKSTSVISAYLGFSSQSHFSRVFKKYADISPNDYREKY